jgi:hypothetical protein
MKILKSYEIFGNFWKLIGLNSILSTLPQSEYTSRAVSTPRVRYIRACVYFFYCLFGVSTLSNQRQDFISSRPIKLQEKVKISNLYTIIDF